VNRQMEDVIKSLKGRVEDGSGSDSGDEEDQDQTEGIKNEEAVDEKRVNLQQAEGPEEPKVVPASTLESPKSTEQEKRLEVEEAGDKKLQAHVNETSLNADQENSIKELHSKYPRYSEELLTNMLADQDGDLKELEALLKTLQRQEIRAANRKVSGPSSSKATDNTDVSTESPPSKLQNASKGKTRGKSAKKRERDTTLSVGRVHKTRRKNASDDVKAASKTPPRDNVNSASPSSPLVVLSDSDFE